MPASTLTQSACAEILALAAIEALNTPKTMGESVKWAFLAFVASSALRYRTYREAVKSALASLGFEV